MPNLGWRVACAPDSFFFDPMNLFFLIPEIHTNFCRRVACGPDYFF